MRIIPKQTKVSIEFFKGIELIDALVGLVCAALIVMALVSNIPYNFIVSGVLLMFSVLLLAPIDDNKGYVYALQVLKYLSQPKLFVRAGSEADTPPQSASEPDDVPDTGKKGKKVKKAAKKKAPPSVDSITGFTAIHDDVIDYGGKYYAKVISIDSIEFRFLSEMRQNSIIDRVVGGVIRLMTIDETMMFVKIDRPVIFDSYIDTEYDKIEQIKEAYLNSLVEEDEFYTRAEIVYDRIEDIMDLNYGEKVYKPFHYLVIMDRNFRQLEDVAYTAAEQLKQGDLPVKILNSKELAVFLKYNYTKDFDERDIEKINPKDYVDWVLPKKIEFTARTVRYDGLVTHNLRVINYPQVVGNAWGYKLFNIPDTKVVMKMQMVDRNRAIKNIDRSIDELRGQETTTGKTSKLIELSNHIDTLGNLLMLLQNDTENLYDVTLMVTVYDEEETERLKNPPPKTEKAKKKGLFGRKGKVEEEAPALSPAEAADNEAERRRGTFVSAKKRIRRTLAEEGFRSTDMLLQQFEAYSCSLIGVSNPMRKKARSIHSTSIAAAFPFVYSNLMDEGGVNIGAAGGVPVFLNFFRRDKDRVNSNMVIIGKSGGGKSFAAKTILSHLAAEDSKIFILDPENEYAQLTTELKGKLIDVGTATQGRMNPFHIITSLSDEESGEDEKSTGFSAHLQFLEEFFKQILPGIESEPLEFLNNMITRMYEEKGIDEFTDFTAMAPEDFPVFDDLYDRILTETQVFTSEYNKAILRSLLNYISKFAAGGRNSNLWNGPASISTKENFIVFNFQSLLANQNNTIANAQMLLVLKWLNNEIIKNRDYNMKYNAQRKVIIVIDEAHVFIDEKFPIALDFMHQLAKRIRKYSGMQIVITQNIKDFVGTEELARKSTAIINACQYSMIFPLAPNDMHDLCKLYEKAGAINEVEQDEIVNNGRGNAFVITSPTSRSTVGIVASEALQRKFM